MPILVFLEKENNKIRKVSFEAISYACEVSRNENTSVIGVILGDVDKDALNNAALYGCDKIIHVQNLQRTKNQLLSKLWKITQKS